MESSFRDKKKSLGVASAFRGAPKAGAKGKPGVPYVAPMGEVQALQQVLAVLAGDYKSVLPQLQVPLGKAVSQMQRRGRLMPAIYAELDALDIANPARAQQIRDGILGGRWALLLPV